MTRAADPFLAFSEAGGQLLPASFFALDQRAEVQVYATRAPGDMTLLSADEQARLSTFQSPKRRAEFLRGRSLLRSVLAARFGMEASVLPLSSAPSGGFAPLEEALHLSLTHTGSVAAIALAPYPVGLDVERIRPVPTGLIARMCAENEMIPQHEAGALLTWAAKEAVLKASGEGLRGGLRQVCLNWLDGAALPLRATATSPQQPFSVVVRQTPGLVWALAFPETGVREGRSDSTF